MPIIILRAVWRGLPSFLDWRDQIILTWGIIRITDSVSIAADFWLIFSMRAKVK